MPYNPDGSFTLAQNFGTGTPPSNMFPPQVGSVLSDIATSIDINNIIAQPVFVAYVDAELATKAGLVQTDFISGGIKIPANQGYIIVLYFPFAVTITYFTANTQAGSCTAKLTIAGGADITGSTITAATSAGSATITTGNTMSLGQALILNISSVSAVTDLAFTVVFTRPLVP